MVSSRAATPRPRRRWGRAGFVQRAGFALRPHWLHRARVRQAQYLLEATAHSPDRIAAQVGFGSPTAFRERFKRIVGTSPNAYRAAFHGRETG